MNNKPIGVYDSGIGGLTVFAKLVKLMPNENFIYFGDTANIPYGTKTKEELLKITHNIMSFFEKHDTKAVVMACNTTSAVAYDSLKNDFQFKLYPLIQTACKMIAEQNIKRIGTLSTEATANSHAYKTHLQIYNPKLEVIEHGCPGKWTEMVENGTQKENYEIIKTNLQPLLDAKVEKIILGCTHYPYLKDILIQIAGKDIFIDPSRTFAEYIAHDMIQSKNNSEKRIFEPEFYVSANPEKFHISSKIFYNVAKLPKLEERTI